MTTDRMYPSRHLNQDCPQLQRDVINNSRSNLSQVEANDAVQLQIN